MTDLGKDEFKDVLELYLRAYSHYNTTLEIVRKIMVYFPPQVSTEVKDTMAELTSMSPEQFKEVQEYIKKMKTEVK